MTSNWSSLKKLSNKIPKKLEELHLKKEHLLLFALFFVFIFIRLFSDSSYIFATGDPGKYLGIAKNFPSNELYNDELFLSQRPLYPYAIYILGLLFGDYNSGILISLISAAISFFLIYKLTNLLFRNKYISIFTLVLFSLSSIFIGLSINVAKESFSTMLILATLYTYIKFLKFNNLKYLIFSALFGILVGLTLDQSIFLIPGMITIFFLFRGNTKLAYALIPLILVVLSYSSWDLVRMYTYSTHDYYPAGWDGTIVNTKEWGVRQLLSNHYFPEMEVYVPFGINLDPERYIYSIAYMANLIIFPWPNGLRFGNISELLSKDYLIQGFLYPLLFIFAAFAVYKIITRILSKKVIKADGMLLGLLLFLIFLIPIHQISYSIRYTLTSIVFLYMIMSYGFYLFVCRFGSVKLFRTLMLILIVSLLFYVPFYYSDNPNFIFKNKKIIQSAEAAKFLNQLPKDGVMAQIGYTPELAYLTDKRVVALTIDSSNFLELIKAYKINYLVYGEAYAKPFSVENKEKVINYDTIKYIVEHSEEFELIKIVTEVYPWGKQDNFYIYEVKNKI